MKLFFCRVRQSQLVTKSRPSMNDGRRDRLRKWCESTCGVIVARTIGLIPVLLRLVSEYVVVTEHLLSGSVSNRVMD